MPAHFSTNHRARSSRSLGVARSGTRRRVVSTTLAAATTLATLAFAAQASTAATTNPRTDHASSSTVWLCRPGTSDDPCTSSLAATSISASGAKATVRAVPARNSKYDCFYVYPTVSRELSTNADLRIQKAEIAVAVAQASRFSQVCRVWAPMYRQVTLAGLAESDNLDVGISATATAYAGVKSAFQDYLQNDNDGRPIVFIGHSQGAAMLIKLLAQMVDNNATLRSKLVMAVILGGNVEVRTGSLTGGSFNHIPLCNASGEAGCVLAYSSFPSEPPADSLFGRPGQGVSLQSGQTNTKGLQVACVNPAAIGGGTAELDPYFPSTGSVSTPWVNYPNLYSASCRTSGGATWLQVAKSSGSSDSRPLVTETDGPEWGFHVADVNLGLGDLVPDVAAAESHMDGATSTT